MRRESMATPPAMPQAPHTPEPQVREHAPATAEASTPNVDATACAVDVSQVQSAQIGQSAGDLMQDRVMVDGAEPLPEWMQQVETLNRFAVTPSSDAVAEIAELIPRSLRDLRSKLVIAAADAAIAAAKYLSSEQVVDIFKATVTGANVTKKVMAEANNRAARAILRTTVDEAVWDEVASKMSDEHTPARCLVVSVTTQLVNVADVSTHEFVKGVAARVLHAGIVDRMVQVRDESRNLLKACRARFGKERADALLESLGEDVRQRFIRSMTNASGANAREKKKPASNFRDLIKAKRAANKAAVKDVGVEGSTMAVQAVGQEVEKMSMAGTTGNEENAIPVEGKRTSSVAFALR